MTNILLTLLAVATFACTYIIFKEFWFSSYGARLPWKHVRFKGFLLVPGTVTAIGLLSLFTTEMTDSLDTFPVICLTAVIVSAALQLIRWKRAPLPIDVPLDSVVKSQYSHALRIDPAEHLSEDDPRWALFEHSDTYLIPNARMATLASVLIEHLKLTGHIIRNGSDYELTRTPPISMHMMRIESDQNLGNKETASWEHSIALDRRLGFVSIHSEPVA